MDIEIVLFIGGLSFFIGLAIGARLARDPPPIECAPCEVG